MVHLKVLYLHRRNLANKISRENKYFSKHVLVPLERTLEALLCIIKKVGVHAYTCVCMHFNRVQIYAYISDIVQKFLLN